LAGATGREHATISSGGRTRHQDPESYGVLMTDSLRRRPGLIAASLVCAHVVLALVLAMGALSLALTVGGPEIGRDELYRLGPAPKLAVLGACLPVLIATTSALVLSFSARRQRAWLAPVIGMIASVLLTGLGLAFLRAPEPLVGG
jgi:hypothetical protein